MKTDYDVIIIGAGPAGSSCAKHLTDNGFKTLVIEKHKLPRYKCCSGLLSDRSIKFINENFGKIPNKIICENKEVKFMFSMIGSSFVDAESEIFLKIYRNALDYWLINESKAEIIDECFYINKEDDNNKIKVHCKLNNKIIEFNCKFLVGADGGNSRLRKTIDPQYQTVEKLFAIQVLYQGKIDLEKKYFYYLLGKKYSQQYAWFHYEDDLLYLGTSFYLNKKQNNFLDTLTNRLKTNYNLSIINEIRKEGCFLDPRSNESKFYFGDKNTLLTGESTGIINGYYEGISSALITGGIAAKSIIKFQNSTDSLLNIYRNEIIEEKEYALKSWEQIKND